MCSNISTDTIRSNVSLRDRTHSYRRLPQSDFSIRAPRASPSMYSRCEREFDTAMTREFGNCRAIHSDSEPQPQPSSRIDWPSARSACSAVWRSASSSASRNVRGRRPYRSRRNIFASAPARGRRTPPAPHNAAHWPRRYVLRWRGPPFRRRTPHRFQHHQRRAVPRCANTAAGWRRGSRYPAAAPVRRCR